MLHTCKCQARTTFSTLMTPNCISFVSKGTATNPKTKIIRSYASRCCNPCEELEPSGLWYGYRRCWKCPNISSAYSLPQQLHYTKQHVYPSNYWLTKMETTSHWCPRCTWDVFSWLDTGDSFVFPSLCLLYPGKLGWTEPERANFSSLYLDYFPLSPNLCALFFNGKFALSPPPLRVFFFFFFPCNEISRLFKWEEEENWEPHYGPESEATVAWEGEFPFHAHFIAPYQRRRLSLSSWGYSKIIKDIISDGLQKQMQKSLNQNLSLFYRAWACCFMDGTGERGLTEVQKGLSALWDAVQAAVCMW